MSNKKVLVALFVLVVVGSIGMSLATDPFSRESMRRGPEEDWQPLHYELDPQNARVMISIEQAIANVKAAWPVPSDATAEATMMRDDLNDYTHWMLYWSSKDSNLLMADVDAYTGKVLVIVDFRKSGGVDNLKGNEGRAIEVGEEVLVKLGVNPDGLSKPVVRKRDMPGATSWKSTYTVLWTQTHQGFMVRGASVRVGIDAETLMPVAFSNQLIDVQAVNVVPAISEAQAIEAAEKHLQSEAMTSRGYEQCEVYKSGLVIDKPNHDFTLDKILVPLGDPTLVWCIQAREAIHGWLIDVMVDAQTGAVVGLKFGC